MILSVFGSQTALESPDRSHIATGPITSKYYELGTSWNHPGNFSNENSDFLVVEVTYNHRSHHGASLCSEPKSENHRF